MAVGGQEGLAGQAVQQGSGHEELAVVLRAVKHGLTAFGEYMPGKGSAGVLPLALGKAHVAAYDGLAFVRVIVGAGMASSEVLVGQVDVEGLDEVHHAAGEQAQHEGGDAAAQVAFRHDHQIAALGGGVEAGAQADLLKEHGVDIVEHQQVDVVLLGHALHGHGGMHACQELLGIHIGLHGIAGSDVVHHGFGLFTRNEVDLIAQLGDGQEVQLGANLAEDVIGMHISGPHGLVVAGQQTYLGVAQDGAGTGGVAKGGSAHHDLAPGAQIGFEHGTVVLHVVAAGFLSADQTAAAQILGELVVIVGIAEVDFVAHAVSEQNRNRGHIAQEADPGVVLSPAEIDGQNEVDLVVGEQIHRALGVFGVENDAGEADVGDGFAVALHPCGFILLALQIRTALGTNAQRNKTFGGKKQKTHFRLTKLCNHDVSPLSLSIKIPWMMTL